MSDFKKILAVIDPTVQKQKSLDRAIELAQKTNGNITAFLSIYDFSYDLTTMLSLDERETMKQALLDDKVEWVTNLIAAKKGDNNLEIDIKVVWHNRPYESIIIESIQGNYDLIVKGTHKHDTLKSVIFTPTDWHLMRKAPTSVLLVKEHDWPINGQVLAAVNVGTEDDAHRQLNDKVTKVAHEMANVLQANVHLVNSYPGTPVNIAIEIPEFDPQGYNESVKNYHNKSMTEHAQQFQVALENCHVKEGLPEDVIPNVAKEIDAELVIIGTIGRHGISAALIGNTAEHVIDMLDCDILALKPDGFESPVIID
ncbi:universal stress protein UspE [Alteromonas sp. a30]|uniref:universal stress protein UspE n=1 Tax=Alteromonas sp. a30 TaxID=2730917 RepID=UPI00227D9F3B|nr:universal stress protein UspE [Alteromonas sp. a30]MCY7293871.1 universal stress protein UspE [Alteromonas sp. a30]